MAGASLKFLEPDMSADLKRRITKAVRRAVQPAWEEMMATIATSMVGEVIQ